MQENFSQVKIEIKKNLDAINLKIASILPQDRRNLTLIAVSKKQSFEKIKIAYDLGIRDFGESYLKELSLKMDLAKKASLDDIRWHFIGNIQKNKIKLLENVDFVHSISSVEKAILLNSFVIKKIQIFLQINLDNQEGRLGFFYNDILNFLPDILKLNNLNVRGLMCILPLDNRKDYWFEQMQLLKKQIIESGLLNTVDLSMGMSDDFEKAIKHGSTFLRIGSALFGERDKI